MNILYLYAEVMGYTMATIRSLLSRGLEVYIFHKDTRKLTPYQPVIHRRVTFYPRSGHSLKKIRYLVSEIKPEIVVVSGWADNAYLIVARQLRKSGIPVVAGFDDQWHHTIKQRVGSIIGHIGLLKQFFSHAWVSGPYQYEYARRLGFNKKEIIYDLYSADLQVFNECYLQNNEKKKLHYPHRFLFVGRLEKIKGVDVLANAWQRLGYRRKNWQMRFIGNGALKGFLAKQEGVDVRDFIRPEAFQEEVAVAGCFILPSRNEHWGVVIQEFAAAGLPLISSDVCGAAQQFLINGYNGFKFASEDVNALADNMLKIIESDDETLRRMGEYSHNLAQRITPDTSAANLLSIKQ